MEADSPRPGASESPGRANASASATADGFEETGGKRSKKAAAKLAAAEASASKGKDGVPSSPGKKALPSPRANEQRGASSSPGPASLALSPAVAGEEPPLRVARLHLAPVRVHVALSVRRSGLAVRQLAKLVLGDYVIDAEAGGGGGASGVALTLSPFALAVPVERRRLARAVVRSVQRHYLQQVVPPLLRVMMRSWRLQLLLALLAALLATLMLARLIGIGWQAASPALVVADVRLVPAPQLPRIADVAQVEEADAADVRRVRVRNEPADLRPRDLQREQLEDEHVCRRRRARVRHAAKARAHARSALRAVRAGHPRRDELAVVVGLVDHLIEGRELREALEVVVRPDVLDEHGVEIHVADSRVRVAWQHLRLVRPLLIRVDKSLRDILAVGVDEAIVVASAAVVVLDLRAHKGSEPVSALPSQRARRRRARVLHSQPHARAP